MPYSARSAEEYLRTRVDFKTEAYRIKGDMYRRWYLATATTSAIAAAAVPVLINLNIPSIYPTILSLLVTALVGAEGIFHWREHWKNYDLMKSYLRQEACLYQAKGGPYREQTLESAFVLLVERVEEAIARERTQTIQMRTSVTRQNQSSDSDAPSEKRGSSATP
ncbi:MAG: DUF4231 domain-containing protein [Proteobacteria bacterium]|nr:DUF4231 domain-containing protein [Pseudomonadota bacterium]